MTSLQTDLRAEVEGDVLFSHGDRALYATDGSNYRQVPIGVFRPRHERDVVRGVAVCRAHEAPIVGRGAGTSLAGQGCNEAVVFDFSRYMDRIVEVDPEARVARVQPGVILDTLRERAEGSGLTFGPDPATHAYCTIGGMLGNNSCGVHSVMAGKTDENVEGLRILTFDGAVMDIGPTSEQDAERIIARGGPEARIYVALLDLRDKYAQEIRAGFPDIPRRVSGYNLPWLLPENGFDVARALVGSEGTCALILEAKVRLVISPRCRVLAVLGYPDIFRAADAVPGVLAAGCIGLEGFDDVMVDCMRRKRLHVDDLGQLPDGRGWLLAEFGGHSLEEAETRARALSDSLARVDRPPSVRVLADPREQRRMWAIRESGLAASVRVPGEPDTWEGWEDAAVPPARLGGYLRDLKELAGRYGYRCPLYGHFGDGCVHNRMTFDLRTADGVAAYRRFVREAAELVVSYGGSLSGEHGDGQSRGELLPIMFGPSLMRALADFKAIWDPQGRMNPGKLINPYRVDEHLRLGPQYRPRQLPTTFRFPADDGSLARAAERCVGVGACLRLSGGVMCPSYMVTREERHSTRGRAHLLFEMARGDTLPESWRAEAVKESLDLCLACKGCKSDCPVGVDVATYKSEFLSHYYRGRLRPRAAYSMGLIHWWVRLGAQFPHVANRMLRGRLLSAGLKRLGGVASERTIPPLAPVTFERWFRTRRAGGVTEPTVVVWPDTFTNHFAPSVGKAGVRVLEAAGFRVVVPSAPVCCGRPLYDFGMLHLARRQLRRAIRTLRPWITSRTPVVGFEPSCVAVFRDELPNLLPDDEEGRLLAGQTHLLSELLLQSGHGLNLPKLSRKAVVQVHCHQHAVMGFEHERAILSALGLDFEVLDSGCCGMAGSFGFDRGEKYEVSVAAAERVLLPAVRKASPDTLILADGFSCREQISQVANRRALHFAEVLAMALDSK